MTNTRFIRKIENFTCEFCGAEIQGNGYTNHCTECLVSKHVDVYPGDRASSCQGLMMPVAIERKNGQSYIVHKCQKCGFERRNKVCPEDCYEAVLSVARGDIALYHKILLAHNKRR